MGARLEEPLGFWYPKAMILEANDYRKVLSQELERRMAANARYSLRAFSRKLGVSPSTLSEVLSGKQGLSKTNAERIAERLQMSKAESEYFTTLVDLAHGRSKRTREAAEKRISRMREVAEKPLQLESFTMIAEWHHLAILELSRTKNFEPTPGRIARRLGLTTAEVRLAIERLLRLGVLRKEGERLVPTGRWLVTSPNDIPSASIRQFHGSILQKAGSAMHEQPVEERNYSSLVLAIRQDQLGEAKKLIMEFNRRLSKLLTDADDRDALYCFSTQLFSLEKRADGEGDE